MTDDDEMAETEHQRLGELFVSATGESTTRKAQDDAAPKRVRDTTASTGTTPGEELGAEADAEVLEGAIDDP